MKLTKRGAILLALAILVLIGLYLASTTDMIFSEVDQEVYNISILIDSYTDVRWENFKTGMNQAALRYNVDANFVTLISDDASISQAERVEREMDNHVQALIFYSEDQVELAGLMENTPANVPVVLLGTAPDLYEPRVTIKPDSVQMGIDLAARVLADQDDDEQKIVILHRLGDWMNYDLAEEAFRTEISKSGVEVETLEVPSLFQTQRVINEIRPESDVSLVVFDPELLEYLITLFQEEDSGMPLYGMSWSDTIRRGIETGIVKAVAVPNAYEQGYLAIQQAVRTISENFPPRIRTVDHVVVGLDEIYEKPYEVILFPIK